MAEGRRRPKRSEATGRRRPKRSEAATDNTPGAPKRVRVRLAALRSPPSNRGSNGDCQSPTVPQTQMIISFFRTIARRTSKGHSNARKSPTVPQTQMIISFSRTRARRASEGHSNARKSPTVPQTQMIISFLSPFILSILFIPSKFSCPA